MLGFSGVTAIEDNVAVLTVRTVEPPTPFRVAEMVEVPVARVDALPLVSMVATAAFADDQVTRLVMSRSIWSVYDPMASNCWRSPFAIDGLTGVTETPVRAGR